MPCLYYVVKIYIKQRNILHQQSPLDETHLDAVRGLILLKRRADRRNQQVEEYKHTHTHQQSFVHSVFAITRVTTRLIIINIAPLKVH